MNVASVLMDILKAAGVRYLFGNPGTTELPFLDALPESRLEYVLGLQEATAVAAADGYAQATARSAWRTSTWRPASRTASRSSTTRRGRSHR
jgi:thiamine pyrophosphate-dependent acetolactate synthase large subunit-like protein